MPVAENLEEEYKEQALSPIICAGRCTRSGDYYDKKTVKYILRILKKRWLQQQLIFRQTDGVLKIAGSKMQKQLRLSVSETYERERQKTHEKSRVFKRNV